MNSAKGGSSNTNFLKYGKFKLYDVVRIIEDKDFICPVEHMKKGSEGTIVEICEDEEVVSYIVEIGNEVYDSLEEIEAVG